MGEAYVQGISQSVYRDLVKYYGAVLPTGRVFFFYIYFIYVVDLLSITDVMRG